MYICADVELVMYIWGIMDLLGYIWMDILASKVYLY